MFNQKKEEQLKEIYILFKRVRNQIMDKLASKFKKYVEQVGS